MAVIYVRSTDGSDSDNGSTWALAKASVAGALAIAAAGDTIWVSDNHAESTAGTVTWTCPAVSATPVKILCGDDAAEPPTALATTATVTANANAPIAIIGHAYVYGINFVAGTGAADTLASIAIGSSTVPAAVKCDTCTFRLNTTSTVFLLLGQAAQTTGDHVLVELEGCSLRCGATTQGVVTRHVMAELNNFSLNSAGSTPTTFCAPTASTGGHLRVRNSDLTGEAFTNIVDQSIASPSVFQFDNSKLPASVTLATGTHPGPGGLTLLVTRCANGDTQNYFAKAGWQGTVEHNTAIYLTDGLADYDGTAFSAKMTATANANLINPLTYEFAFEVTAVGSSKTYSVEIAVDGASVTLQNDDAWLEIDAYTTSGSTLGAVQSSRVSSVIATPANLTTSSASWTGLNATNSRFTLSVTFTPQEKGIYRARVCVGEASRTLYVAAKVTEA